MRSRQLATLVLALVTVTSIGACSSLRRTLGLGGSGTGSTSPYGHWVLATPIDSTAFAGATQVELVLSPGSFNLSAAYPNRPPLTVGGSAALADGGLLTLVPGSGDGATVGFTPGQPFTRMVSAAGATLVLAPPTASVPLPSSVWHRMDVARAAGLVR
jgi:hypothetical protein